MGGRLNRLCLILIGMHIRFTVSASATHHSLHKLFCWLGSFGTNSGCSGYLACVRYFHGHRKHCFCYITQHLALFHISVFCTHQRPTSRVCVCVLSHRSLISHQLTDRPNGLDTHTHTTTTTRPCTALHTAPPICGCCTTLSTRTASRHLRAAGSITSNDSGHGSCAPADHTDSGGGGGGVGGNASNCGAAPAAQSHPQQQQPGLYHVASSIVHNTPSPTLMQQQQQQLLSPELQQPRRHSSAMHGKRN